MNNSKGKAALIAVLISVLICVGTVVGLAVTGHFKIGNIEVTDASVSTAVKTTTTSSSESSIEEEPVSLFAEKSANYKTISIKKFSSKSAMLIDLESDTILAGKDYTKKVYPASLTKLMTILVATENIKDYKKTYTFTASDIEPLVAEDASRAGFSVGEKVTMTELLYAAILPSGADGTIGLAKSVAGSEKAFVKLMNEKAEELGLKNTHFCNASGLHNKDHYTTVEDLSVIAKQVFESKICRKIIFTKTHTTAKTNKHKKGIKLNSIIGMRFDGYFIDADKDGKADSNTKILGGKTGFTNEAGCTLVSFCQKNDKYYLAVSTKATMAQSSVEDHIALYEKYLGNTSVSDDSSNDTSTESVADSSNAA